VLVLGGSQGARQVNELVGAVLPGLRGRARVAHQTGPGREPCRPADEGYKGFEYVGAEMPDLLAAADVIVGRAGAGTIWEAVAAGKPMILIPLAAASRGDQLENARLLAEAGAAVCLAGDEATPDALMAALIPLLGSTEKRLAMAESGRLMAKPGAADAIAAIILDSIRKEGDA
jgi:UDP-N-acetylglucosamine--N-acetylmuramyl-(pentapeptide) pyrophosphoryl-undecaprenol N-acetylglucosamine transferase